MPSIYDVPFWSKQFYDHKARWIHYFQQVQFVARELRKRGGSEGFKLLEVGPSHGFVTSYLRKFGVSVTTIDNKKVYEPDIVGSVLKMPIADNSFDMILVCEVLEHLPWSDFSVALAELRRVTNKYVLLSVPDVRSTLFSGIIKVPFLKPFECEIRVPSGKKHVRPVPGGHEWEIGKRGYPPKRIKEEIIRAGFVLEDERVFIDTPKNHYFLMRKIDGRV